MAHTNRQITLASRPSGFPAPSDFRLAVSPMLWPARGQVLVQTSTSPSIPTCAAG